MHGTKAGLPSGMPGMGEEIEGMMQQAPQPGLHFMLVTVCPAILLALSASCARIAETADPIYHVGGRQSSANASMFTAGLLYTVLSCRGGAAERER